MYNGGMKTLSESEEKELALKANSTPVPQPLRDWLRGGNCPR